MARLVVQMTEDVPLKYILDPTKLQPSKWYGPKDELNRLNKEIQKAKKWTEQLKEEEVFDACALNSFHPEVVQKAVETAAKKNSDFIVLDHIHRILFDSKEGVYTEIIQFPLKKLLCAGGLAKDESPSKYQRGDGA